MEPCNFCKGTGYIEEDRCPFCNQTLWRKIKGPLEIGAAIFAVGFVIVYNINAHWIWFFG